MRLHKRHMQSRKEEVTDMLMYAGNHQFYWPGINAVGGRGRGRGQGQQPESAQLKMEKYLDELCDDLEMSPKDFLRWLLEHPLQKQSLQPLPPCASMAVRERLAEYIKAYTECVVFLDEQDRAILARPNMFYDARHIEKPRGNWFETRFKPKEPWFVSWLQAQRASGRIMRRSADAERAAGCSQQSDQQDLGLYSELHEVNLVGEVRFYFRHMKASPP